MLPAMERHFSQAHSATGTGVQNTETLRSAPKRCELCIHQAGKFQTLLNTYFQNKVLVLCHSVIFALKGKTSHASQLQPCFTEHDSRHAFQVIHPQKKNSNKTHEVLPASKCSHAPDEKHILKKYQQD
jgi:hypothetical protein